MVCCTSAVLKGMELIRLIQLLLSLHANYLHKFTVLFFYLMLGEEYGDEVFSFFLYPMDTINGIRNGGLLRIIEYCVYHFLSSDTDAACCCLFVFLYCAFFFV